MKAKLFTISLAIAALAGTSLTSCDDFLTEDPKGQITPDGFFTSQKRLDAAVNALYFNVQQSQCNSNPMIVQCQGSDLTSTTGSNKAAYLSADAFEEPSDYKGINFVWLWNYNIIQAANLIVDYAPGTTGVSKESIDLALGQGYFWRAYAYFNLVRVFGPLPMNLHNEADNNKTTLTPVDKVYEQIVSDLKHAEECNLPAKYTGANQAIGGMNIFVSQQAVKSTLAAVYMNMAGYPLNLGAEYYGLAADKAKEVVDGVNNGLYPQSLVDWKDVYSYGNNYSSETVLAMVYNATTGGWSNYDSQLSSCHQLGDVEGGWGDFLAERSFWASFPDGPRKDYVFAKQLRSGNGVTVDWWATKDGEPYYSRQAANDPDKTETNAVILAYRPMYVGFTVNAAADGKPAEAPFDYTAPFWGGMCINKTHQLIRYSEVLCWFAEASARSGKYASEAAAALGKVQARAYANVADADNSDLAEAALREHMWEIAGNACALVTVRADEFRTERLESVWAYRHGEQTTVLVPAGTLTQSVDSDGNPFTYTLKQDVVLKENMTVAPTWKGENSIYQVYPPTETERNPNLKR